MFLNMKKCSITKITYIKNDVCIHSKNDVEKIPFANMTMEKNVVALTL